jgi:hypothetical protein
MRRSMWFVVGLAIGATLTLLWGAHATASHARWEPPQRARKYPLRPALYFQVRRVAV